MMKTFEHPGDEIYPAFLRNEEGKVIAKEEDLPVLDQLAHIHIGEDHVQFNEWIVPYNSIRSATLRWIQSGIIRWEEDPGAVVSPEKLRDCIELFQERLIEFKTNNPSDEPTPEYDEPMIHFDNLKSELKAAEPYEQESILERVIEGQTGMIDELDGQRIGGPNVSDIDVGNDLIVATVHFHTVGDPVYTEGGSQQDDDGESYERDEQDHYMALRITANGAEWERL